MAAMYVVCSASHWAAFSVIAYDSQCNGVCYLSNCIVSKDTSPAVYML